LYIYKKILVYLVNFVVSMNKVHDSQLELIRLTS
jgi:hypothetical protein